MRPRGIPGFKSERARAERSSLHQEVVERLEDVGVPTGGFGDSVRSRMSPQLLRQIATAEAQEAYEAAKEDRKRAVRAQQWQERSEESARQIAIVEALEAGEDASPRALRGERLGHTVGEFVALMSARQDVEDAALEAAKAHARRRWEAAYDAGQQADVSAPSQRQLDDQELFQQRLARQRARSREHLFTLEQARKQTYTQIKTAERYRDEDAGREAGYRIS